MITLYTYRWVSRSIFVIPKIIAIIIVLNEYKPKKPFLDPGLCTLPSYSMPNSNLDRKIKYLSAHPGIGTIIFLIFIIGCPKAEVIIVNIISTPVYNE